MQFSVVMATYNGERFLQEQLDSLARQTLLPFELVVCDDASQDATVAILEDFRQSAPFPVRILRNDMNIGYGDTFLKAAEAAVGDWIGFCDQDDVWLNRKLSRCDDVLSRHPEIDLLSHSADQVDEQLRPLPHRAPDYRRWQISGPLKRGVLSGFLGFTCVVRRSLIECAPASERPRDAWRPGYRQPHDTFISHLSNVFGHTGVIPESLALYRRHGGSLTGCANSRVRDTSLKARLKFSGYTGHAGFEMMADQARQHRDFYALVCRRAECKGVEDSFLARARRAVDYYDAIAQAFETRASIYSKSASFTTRFKSLVRSALVGAYATPAIGAASGLARFAKDVLRTCGMIGSAD